MDKKHLHLVRVDDKTENGQAPLKKRLLVERAQVEHINTPNMRMETFESGRKEAHLGFVYEKEGETWPLLFEFEVIIDTLMVEFDAKDVPEAVRLEASRILMQLVEALRFVHKDKYWAFSHYFIDDEESYRKRLNPVYALKLEAEWKRISSQSQKEMVDAETELFLIEEDIHDMSLLVAGEDGYLLCEVLQALHIASYEPKGRHLYELHLKGREDGMRRVHRKIIMAREIAAWGYNIWTDYLEH